MKDGIGSCGCIGLLPQYGRRLNGAARQSKDRSVDSKYRSPVITNGVTISFGVVSYSIITVCERSVSIKSLKYSISIVTNRYWGKSTTIESYGFTGL